LDWQRCRLLTKEPRKRLHSNQFIDGKESV
jgi:hypothetical protein